MLVRDFNFALPQDQIARYPLPVRDASRLMVVERSTGRITDEMFSSLPNILLPGDLLVLNDTRVIPARVFGRKETGGEVELFLVRRSDCPGERWLCFVRASRRCREGQSICLADDMTAVIRRRVDQEMWEVEFSGHGSFADWLEREGHIPLPPYLQRTDEVMDRERYQTVFSQAPGAVAAPTAGLHFTTALLDDLRESGIRFTTITLHTGPGTFQPVRVEHVEDHRIHSEHYRIPPAAVEAIRAARERGGRVIAVGTTSARTLEHAAATGTVTAGEGDTDIFIYPGYEFRAIDGLITNFHLPESTLLMLVSALAGRELVLKAYDEAIQRGFRFYSYGDAMIIL